MSRYALGTYARAMCDRCGFEIKYLDLKTEWTGLRVCESCLDPKTKQEFPDPVQADAEALRDPSGDSDVEAGLGIARSSSEDPVGKSIRDNKLTVTLGDVTVSIT